MTNKKRPLYPERVMKECSLLLFQYINNLGMYEICDFSGFFQLCFPDSRYRYEMFLSLLFTFKSTYIPNS